jgi:hypothetical protein
MAAVVAALGVTLKAEVGVGVVCRAGAGATRALTLEAAMGPMSRRVAGTRVGMGAVAMAAMVGTCRQQ